MKPYDIRRKLEMTRRYTAAAATAEEKEAAVSKAHDYVMLLYTRTCDNPKATEALERNIRRMAGNGMFTDDEIEGFRMK